MKKILSLIAALTLTAGAGVTPVLAAEEEASTTTTFGKKYTLIGDGTSPEETFTFTATFDHVTDSSNNDIIKAPTPAVTSMHFDAGDAKKGDDATEKTASLDFSNIQYTSVGYYYYTITEDTPDTPTKGVTYSSAAITAIVTVVNDETNDGFKVHDVRYVGTDGNKMNDGEVEFENTYKASGLTVTKNIEGLMGDKKAEFDINITLSGLNENVTATVDGAEYTFKDGVATTVKLGDEDSISIANLPNGATYTVSEADPDDYTATYTGTGTKQETTVAGKTTETGMTGTITSEASNVVVTNTKGWNPPTGIITDNAPYIALIGIVAVGAIVFFARRRNVEE